MVDRSDRRLGRVQGLRDIERGDDRIDKERKVRQEIPVGVEAPEKTSVVAEEGHAESLIPEERNFGIGLEEPGPEQLERELRARNVRHDQIEGRRTMQELNAQGEQRRRRPVGSLREELRSQSLLALLELPGRIADPIEA